jgi:hypothetical protein
VRAAAALEESGFYDRSGAFSGFGVGVNTAIFRIVSAVLLRSFLFLHPDRLVKIVANNRGLRAGKPAIDFLGPFFEMAAIRRSDLMSDGTPRP